MRTAPTKTVLRSLACAALWALAACKGSPHSSRLVEVSQTECVKCHDGDYVGTRDPVHEGLFATTCADCHSTTEWTNPPGFDHDSWFPRVGKHVSTPCASCHTVAYDTESTPETCAGCHQADADNAVSRDHSGFPETCSDCHLESGWRPAVTHPEPDFPLTEGSHTEVECAGCHNAERGSNINGLNTDCIGCHDGSHDRALMAEEHADVDDYPENDLTPNFCLSCHPSGQL